MKRWALATGFLGAVLMSADASVRELPLLRLRPVLVMAEKPDTSRPTVKAKVHRMESEQSRTRQLSQATQELQVARYELSLPADRFLSYQEDICTAISNYNRWVGVKEWVVSHEAALQLGTSGEELEDGINQSTMRVLKVVYNAAATMEKEHHFQCDVGESLSLQKTLRASLKLLKERGLSVEDVDSTLTQEQIEDAIFLLNPPPPFAIVSA
jgi:hypothetical protein